MFGDTGTDNPRALPRLCRDTQQGRYDAVLHVGEASARVRLEVWGRGGGAWVGGNARTTEGTWAGASVALKDGG